MTLSFLLSSTKSWLQYFMASLPFHQPWDVYFFFKHSCLQHANKNWRSFNTAICLLKTSKPFFARASFEPAQSANSLAPPRCVLCRQNKTTVHCEHTGIFLSQVLNLALLHPSAPRTVCPQPCSSSRPSCCLPVGWRDTAANMDCGRDSS